MNKSLFLFCIVFAFCVQGFAQTILNSHKDPKYGEAVPFKKIAGTGGAMSLEISDKKLYALENGGLSIFDISDPKNPKRMGHVGGMGNVRQLRVRGDTAFLTARQCGLWAVDVSDPHDPKIISNFDGVEMATGLDVVGDVAFLGNRVYGIQCVNVANPAKMKHIASMQTDESQSVMYAGGRLFSGDWAGGEITVIDVSNMLAPKAVGKIALDGYGDGMAISGSTLFASTGQHKKSGPPELRYGAGHGLDIFDISNPLKPKKLSRVFFPQIYFGPCDYWTPRVCGNYCFAADTINGVFVLDVSDLKNPKIIGNLILPKRDPEDSKAAAPKMLLDPKVPGDAVSSLAVGDGVLYISGTFTGIYVAEFPKIARIVKREAGSPPKLPNKPFDAAEKGFFSSGPERTNPTRAVAIRGDTAYTANVWDGVKIFKLSADGIKQIGKADVRYVADISRSGDKLYTAEGHDGIGVYKIVSDTKLERIGGLKTLSKLPSFIQFIWAFDGHDVVAATTAESQVFFIDFSNLDAPRIVLNQGGRELLYGDYASHRLASGRFFAMARHCGGFMVFDLANDKPKTLWTDNFPMCSQTGSVAALGSEFLAMRAGGYAFVDPENHIPVQQMKRLDFPGQSVLPKDVSDGSAISRAQFPKSDWEGLVNCDETTGKVAVANRIFRICRTYDFSDKSNPKALKEYKLNANPFVPAFWKGRLVLPCGYSGLLLEK